MKLNIKVIILIIAALIFAYLSGGNLPYTIFYALLLMFLFSLIFVTVKKNSLRLKIALSKNSYHVHDDDKAHIKLSFGGILPVPYLMLTNDVFLKFDDTYKGDLLFLRIHASNEIIRDIRFSIRGKYDFGQCTVNFKDIFYIFDCTNHYKTDKLVTVYPKIYDIDNMIFRGNGTFLNVLNYKSTREDPYTTRDVKKYNYGDNIKKIHWKLSAKHGELFVRNYDTISAEECNIFIDMNEDNYSMDSKGIAEEKMIDFSSSLLNYMVNKEMKSTVYINTKESRKFYIRGREEFKNLMEFFVENKSNGKITLGRFLDMYLSGVLKYSWIGIVKAAIDEKTMKSILVAKQKGYKVTVFYSKDAKHHGNVIEELISNGVECIYIENNLKEWK